MQTLSSRLRVAIFQIGLSVLSIGSPCFATVSLTENPDFDRHGILGGWRNADVLDQIISHHDIKAIVSSLLEREDIKIEIQRCDQKEMVITEYDDVVVFVPETGNKYHPTRNYRVTRDVASAPTLGRNNEEIFLENGFSKEGYRLGLLSNFEERIPLALGAPHTAQTRAVVLKKIENSDAFELVGFVVGSFEHGTCFPVQNGFANQGYYFQGNGDFELTYVPISGFLGDLQNPRYAIEGKKSCFLPKANAASPRLAH